MLQIDVGKINFDKLLETMTAEELGELLHRLPINWSVEDVMTIFEWICNAMDVDNAIVVISKMREWEDLENVIEMASFLSYYESPDGSFLKESLAAVLLQTYTFFTLFFLILFVSFFLYRKWTPEDVAELFHHIYNNEYIIQIMQKLVTWDERNLYQLTLALYHLKYQAKTIGTIIHHLFHGWDKEAIYRYVSLLLLHNQTNGFPITLIVPILMELQNPRFQFFQQNSHCNSLICKFIHACKNIVQEAKFSKEATQDALKHLLQSIESNYQTTVANSSTETISWKQIRQQLEQPPFSWEASLLQRVIPK